MDTLEIKERRKSINMKDNPVAWLGVISTLSLFALTTTFTWALNIQEKVLSQDSRLKVLESLTQELRGDIKEIKDNVFFLRVNTLPPINQTNVRVK